MAGVYRTGKSYLLNTILLKEKQGFGVGPTVQPKTKGIWVWNQTFPYRNDKDEMINMCVLDSEGLGSVEEDINHDLKLFSITLLLSSMFLYNTLGAIDENAIEKPGSCFKFVLKLLQGTFCFGLTRSGANQDSDIFSGVRVGYRRCDRFPNQL